MPPVPPPPTRAMTTTTTTEGRTTTRRRGARGAPCTAASATFLVAGAARLQLQAPQPGRSACSRRATAGCAGSAASSPWPAGHCRPAPRPASPRCRRRRRSCARWKIPLLAQRHLQRDALSRCGAASSAISRCEASRRAARRPSACATALAAVLRRRSLLVSPSAPAAAAPAAGAPPHTTTRGPRAAWPRG